MRISKRISKNDLEAMEKRVNQLLNSIKLKVAYRYSYAAIDVLDDDGKVRDTLIAGLTKSEAFSILSAIERILRWENKEKELKEVEYLASLF
jgi:TATA-binding protein-associated factor Taf7